MGHVRKMVTIGTLRFQTGTCTGTCDNYVLCGKMAANETFIEIWLNVHIIGSLNVCCGISTKAYNVLIFNIC